ncbi:MAG TPA: hypothetical protein VF981_03170 [Gemmatimonadaceae bacterium]
MNASRFLSHVVLIAVPFALACARDSGPALPDVTTHVPGEQLAFTARWSPDGTRLAFARIVEGKAGIWVTDADGSNPVRLSNGVWDTDPWWSPDGQWIAYNAESPDYDVMLVADTGGESRALTTGPAYDVIAGWLPDGSGVIYLSVSGNLHTRVAMLANGSDRPLIPVEGSVEAQMSPDGTKVAYEFTTGGKTTLWVWDVATAQARQLTTEGRESVDLGVAWSPDSRFLVYRSLRTGSPDLWVADVASGELRQVTTDIRGDFGPRWSPDGQWIAFVSLRGGQQDVWIVSTAGGDAMRVTDDRHREDFLQWTPDGRSVTFGIDGAVAQVRIMPVDGREQRILSFADYNSSQPRVSPDGRWVLFQSDRSGNEDIWVVPTAGGDPRPVTTGALADNQGKWSPDSRWIVFASNRGTSSDLYVVADTGGTPRLLVDWSDTDEGAPHVAPDGRTVAFLSNREARTTDLWTVPIEGGTATRITRLDAGTVLETWSPDGRYLLVRTGAMSGALYRVPLGGGAPEKLSTSTGAQMARWSPDGSRLAYANIAGGYARVFVASALGANPTALTTDEHAYDILPVWSPDGSRVAFETFDFRNSTEDLVVANAADGSLMRITTTPSRNENAPRWTPDGRSLVFTSSERSLAIATANVGPLLERAAAGQR